MTTRQKPLAEFGEGLYPKKDADRAQEVYDKIREVFERKARPTILGYIREKEDGSVCACAVGALAISLGLMKKKSWRANLASGGIPQAVAERGPLSLQELMSLEGGFMGWGWTFRMYRKSALFFEVGSRLRQEFLT